MPAQDRVSGGAILRYCRRRTCGSRCRNAWAVVARLRLVDLAPQDGQLLTQPQNPEVLADVAAWQQPHEAEQPPKRRGGQSQQHEGSPRTRPKIPSRNREPAGHNLWMGFSAPPASLVRICSLAMASFLRAKITPVSFFVRV